jgi:hypothetical protein
MDVKFHKELGRLFEKKLIRENGGPSILCDIYDKLTEGNEMGNNCLGENFNQLIQCIRTDFFKNYKPSKDTSIEFYSGTYIYWLCLIVERYEFLFEVINPDKKYKLIQDFKEKSFVTFKEVKDWCIFFKHPKEFMFCHWPSFVFESDEKHIKEFEKKGYFKIDTKYVSDNFTINKHRLPHLENNPKVYVVLPDLKELTEKFIHELKVFIDFICNNELIVSFLRKKSTVEDYYKELFELGEQITAHNTRLLPVQVSE